MMTQYLHLNTILFTRRETENEYNNNTGHVLGFCVLYVKFRMRDFFSRRHIYNAINREALKMDLLIVICSGIIIVLGFIGYLLYCDVTNKDRYIPRCDFCGRFRKKEDIKMIEINRAQYWECVTCKAKKNRLPTRTL